MRVRRLGWSVAALLLVGCSTTRVVPVPAGGVALDPARGRATVEAEGVEVIVRPSAWAGSPSSLPGYVVPFHLLITNGSARPLAFDYPDLRLFDEARFQYTALPPVEVERILRSSGRDRPADGVPVGGVMVAATAEAASRPILRRRFADPFWDWWWGWPYYPYWPYWPRLDDVFLHALPSGPSSPTPASRASSTSRGFERAWRSSLLSFTTGSAARRGS